MITKKLFKTIPSEYHDFINHVVKLVESHGVKLIMSPDRTVDNCNGYFDDDGDTPTLAVATGQPFEKWILTFIHEACHMDQWHEQVDVWNSCDIKPGVNALGFIDDWIDHKFELTKEQFDNYIPHAYNVEVDCEKRTVDTIKTWNLPIDKYEYIQKANSYIYFYPMLWYTRKWYKPNYEPYNLESIWKAMPTHFVDDYLSVPEHLKLLYIRETLNGFAQV